MFLILVISFGLVLLNSNVANGDPLLTSWKTTTGYGAGYGASLINNVFKIQYSTNYVYVYCNSVPAYSVGPWKNPWSMAAQSFIFKFPRTPSVPTTKSAVPLGHFGIWIDGVTAYSASDGKSYNNLGIWNRNAYYWEASSFDTCNGHCDTYSEYHIHCLPKCLFSYSNSTFHSSLIGFAFDGYPIYGPYGYSSANDSTSSIKLITSSYSLRSITNRTTLSNGTVLSSTYYGPTINSTYPLGSYMEDYAYSSGYGDLDDHNGRWCVTPEYPSGTYAYFVTVDSTYTPQYPYILGPYFYGSPVTSNLVTGPGTTPTETVTTYYSYY